MIKDASPRLDAHTTEIVKWLNEHKYHVASPVDIEFREPNARHPYERAIVSLKSNPDITGDAYLGACSYFSKKDFIENSGYYSQMVDDAIEDLQGSYLRHMEDIIEGIEGLADGQEDELGQLLIRCASELRLGFLPLPV